MAEDFLTLDDFNLEGKTVLVRVDINSPLDPSTGRILNDARIRKHVVTIRDLAKSRVVLLAHQSRPGKADFTTLEAHAERASYLLGRRIRYVDSLFGESAVEAVQEMNDGDVVMLENVRFFSEEVVLCDVPSRKQRETHIVRTLAPLAEYFVHDAFAAAHRSQPTLTGFSQVMPTIAGRVMEDELNSLRRVLKGSDRPKTVILGGVKVDDSLAVMSNLLKKEIVDKILTAGIVGTMFIIASGVEVGKATERFLRKEVGGYEQLLKSATELLDKHGDRIMFPIDVVVNDNGKRKGMPSSELPSNFQIYDVGLDTIVNYTTEISSAKTIIMNGPPGVFEIPEFSFGTEQLMRAVASSKAFKVIGGGHTVAAAEQFDIDRQMDHVSTGGGSLMDYLSGKTLPALEALKKWKRWHDEVIPERK